MKRRAGTDGQDGTTITSAGIGMGIIDTVTIATEAAVGAGAGVVGRGMNGTDMVKETERIVTGIVREAERVVTVMRGRGGGNAAEKEMNIAARDTGLQMEQIETRGADQQGLETRLATTKVTGGRGARRGCAETGAAAHGQVGNDETIRTYAKYNDALVSLTRAERTLAPILRSTGYDLLYL